jgi:hypothetical protein
VGRLFDSLKSGSLLSTGQLRDDDCVALFTKCDLETHKQGQIMVVGERNPANGLWTTPLAPKMTSHQASGGLQDDATKQDSAAFFRATVRSPAPSTFLQAELTLQIVAGPDQITRQQKLGQVPCRQCGPLAHAAKERTINQAAHLGPPQANIPRLQSITRTKQPFNSIQHNDHSVMLGATKAFESPLL